MLLLDRIHIALSPWHVGDFCNIFLPNIGEDQKKSYDLSAGPLAGTASYNGKFGPWMYSQIFCKVSGVFQQNFNCSKNSAVLEPRITFEAKDFKMYLRGRPLGQGRP